jgi:hypothetical protein
MRYGLLGGFVFFVVNLFFAGTRSGYACSVCFGGASSDPVNIGLRNGVIFLLGIVLFVLALFAKFFFGIRKRSKLSLD